MFRITCRLQLQVSPAKNCQVKQKVAIALGKAANYVRRTNKEGVLGVKGSHKGRCDQVFLNISLGIPGCIGIGNSRQDGKNANKVQYAQWLTNRRGQEAYYRQYIKGKDSLGSS